MNRLKWQIIRILIVALPTAVLLEFLPNQQSAILIIFYFVLGLILGYDLEYGKTISGNKPKFVKVLIIFSLVVLWIAIAFLFPAIRFYAFFLPGLLAGPFLRQVRKQNSDPDFSPES
jgi:hypothetical protein